MGAVAGPGAAAPALELYPSVRIDAVHSPEASPGGFRFVPLHSAFKRSAMRRAAITGIMAEMKRSSKMADALGARGSMESARTEAFSDNRSVETKRAVRSS
eukprot:7325870-Prymnesium_polylepis.2